MVAKSLDRFTRLLPRPNQGVQLLCGCAIRPALGGFICHGQSAVSNGGDRFGGRTGANLERALKLIRSLRRRSLANLQAMSTATYDDVNLILKLFELRREEKMRAARSWFVSNFKAKSMAEFGQLCPPGSEPNAMMRQVTSYWDMVSSFVTAGVLNQELLFQSSRELLLCWVRLEPILGEVRAAFQDPNYMKKSGDGCKILYRLP